MDESWMDEVTMDMLPESHRRYAEVIGIKPTLQLCQTFGGTTNYLPVNDAIYNCVVRDKEIKRRYLLGARVNQLAAEYRISDRSVLRIVGDVRPNQISMFG